MLMLILMMMMAMAMAMAMTMTTMTMATMMIFSSSRLEGSGCSSAAVLPARRPRWGRFL